MNLRSQIDAAKAKAVDVSLLGLLPYVAGLSLVFLDTRFAILIIAGVIIIIYGVVLYYGGVRCPRCRRGLGWAAGWPPSKPHKIPKSFRFCPFCGVDFDSDCEEDDETGFEQDSY